MSQQNKKWKVHVELVAYSDYYEPRIIDSYDLSRWGVSEKQVIARLRHTYDWKDYDNATGSISYKWEFKLTEETRIKTTYEQLKLF